MSNLIPASLFGSRSLVDRQFEDLFSNFFDSRGPRRRNTSSSPLANVSKTDTGYSIQVAAPGYSRDAFNVKVEDNVLSITGTSYESNVDTDKVSAQMTTQEFSYGTFTRSWTLPSDVSGEAVTASYEAGILNITVPVEGNKQRVIDINVD